MGRCCISDAAAAAVAQEATVRVEDVRVAPIRHRPVEVMAEDGLLQEAQIGVDRRFQEEENENLMRSPPSGWRQVLDVEVPPVKDDGVAVVQQSSIRRRHAITGCDVVTSGKRLASGSDPEIFRLEEGRPVEKNESMTPCCCCWRPSILHHRASMRKYSRLLMLPVVIVNRKEVGKGDECSDGGAD